MEEKSRKMKRILHFLLVLTAALGTHYAWGQTTVKDVRVWPSPESTRIVFDISTPVDYQIFTLEDPKRIVIDIQNANMGANVNAISWQATPVGGLRHGVQEGNHVRLVLDLNQTIQAKSFLLPPNEQYGHRLVVDLIKTDATQLMASKTNPPGDLMPQTNIAANTSAQPETKSAPIAQTPPPVAQAPATSAAPTTVVRAVKDPAKRKTFIVAIDPGHGGEDPGAIGPSGTREKNVVLAISRELATLVNKEPGMRAYLIRDGDYFVPLRGRIDKARAFQADLFISIHADAFKDSRAHGASVFTLSEHGASSEAARWIAEQENRSDLIGGVSLDDKDQTLASILIDLSQTASNEASLTLGSSVLSRMKGIAPLHGSKQVQQAGFAVLKSPDIPSILVETEFISNHAAEKKLNSKSYQQQMAKAVMHGVREYHRSSAGYHEQLSLTASTHTPKAKQPMLAMDSSSNSQYTIRSGDTLSTVAQQFGISTSTLKQYNNLSTDIIRIGQTLRIPQ
jgi:N-acetylmuramoyl-L-alanine amidase